MHALVASDPLTALAGQTKWDIDGGLTAASRPDWLYGSLDNPEFKNYVLVNNAADLAYLNQHVTNSERAIALFGEPENYWGAVGGIKSLFSSASTKSEKLIGASLSFGANGAVQIMSGNTRDKFDYVGFLASGPTGMATAGKSYYASQLLGAGSAYMTSQITGQDSKAAVLGSMAGTALGYGVGSTITNKFESQYIKNQLGIGASKNALKYSETSFGPGYLLKGSEMSSVPGIAGGAIGSLLSEGASSVTQKETKGGGK